MVYICLYLQNVKGFLVNKLLRNRKLYRECIAEFATCSSDIDIISPKKIWRICSSTSMVWAALTYLLFSDCILFISLLDENCVLNVFANSLFRHGSVIRLIWLNSYRHIPLQDCWDTGCSAPDVFHALVEVNQHDTVFSTAVLGCSLLSRIVINATTSLIILGQTVCYLEIVAICQ